MESKKMGTDGSTLCPHQNLRELSLLKWLNNNVSGSLSESLTHDARNDLLISE